MSAEKKNQYPKLHNATWPGLVGKGGPDAEPIIEFETMLDMTAAAEVDGQRFDGRPCVGQSLRRESELKSPKCH